MEFPSVKIYMEFPFVKEFLCIMFDVKSVQLDGRWEIHGDFMTGILNN